MHGTVFVLTKATGEPWKETVLHGFSGSDGQCPQSALVFGAGPGGSGTIFELAPPSTSGGTWTGTVLYGFTYSRNGQNVVPNGPLLIGPGGTLYTTTEDGPDGPAGFTLGLVVALVSPATPGGAWTENELYTFGFPQGEIPFAGVVSEGGSLFGTTIAGDDGGCGAFGCGTVCELTPPTTQGGHHRGERHHFRRRAMTAGNLPIFSFSSLLALFAQNAGL